MTKVFDHAIFTLWGRRLVWAGLLTIAIFYFRFFQDLPWAQAVLALVFLTFATTVILGIIGYLLPAMANGFAGQLLSCFRRLKMLRSPNTPPGSVDEKARQWGARALLVMTPILAFPLENSFSSQDFPLAQRLINLLFFTVVTMLSVVLLLVFFFTLLRFLEFFFKPRKAEEA